MGSPPSHQRSTMLSSRLTAGLVLFSVVLMAAVLVISIVTLVQVYQIETIKPANNTQNCDQPKPGPNPGPTPGPNPDPSPHPEPEPSPAEQSLNIPQPAEIEKSQGEKYKVYASYVDRLHKSLNFTNDPCNNFYEYACGSYNTYMSFLEIQLKNIVMVIKQIQNPDYMQNPKLPEPVKEAGVLFHKCVDATENWAKEVGKGERLEGKMNKLAGILKAQFPILQNQEVSTPPDASALSTALAHLNREENLPTLVAMGIDVNMKEPHGELPYALGFDQASLILPEAYYTRIWDSTKGGMLADMMATMGAYAEFKGVKVDQATLKADAEAILELEYEIATKLNTPQSVRREFSTMYNIYKTEDANLITDHLKFDVMIETFIPKDADKKRVEKFNIAEAKATKDTMAYIYDNTKVKARTIYNYLFLRLLLANLRYLPAKPKLRTEAFRAGIPRRPPTPRRPPMPLPIWDGQSLDVEKHFGGKELYYAKCAMEHAGLMPWANGRIFLDAKYPKEEDRKNLVADIRLMVANVVDSFKGMLAQLSWMTEQTKKEANDKIQNLVINAGWPEVVEKDEMLNKFYAGLELKTEMTYTEMVDKLNELNWAKQFEKLFTAKDSDRYDFYMSPSIVNAWYNPMGNSITMPLGILDVPFYHPDYPSSVNHGAIALVIGHELTHGFDDQGIQFDGTGVLRNWMDEKSLDGFNKMAKCVVDEYGKFEPMPGLHIDGTMTQGENIADNGGLRSAFHSFRTHVGLHGPDPRLPDPLIKQFNHDQLFFLSFAQVWCEMPDGDTKSLKQQLLTDPHSPSKYRILGSLQNYPTFRSAFNCPLGTAYAPAEHCLVWETDSKIN